MATVTVSVSSTGIISCSPDPVPVSGANATITFNLATSGYAFLANNTVVVSNPASQFPYPSSTSSTHLATLFDANTDSNSYKYTVHLTNTADNSTLSLDPTIENGR
ncbi:hypothetical protein [Ideonella sp.]|uniref:hypothetical protein n=1 Tax=Ideonella sp. TaxID=1929293 RepID=UPI0035B2CEBA